MEAVIKKWGNSLGIRIPNLIIREMSLKDGSFVNIDGKENKIIIKPVRKSKLSEILCQINEENIHEEINATGPIGKQEKLNLLQKMFLKK
jgi:antitoxin MazE